VRCSGNPGNGPCGHCSRLDLGCSFTQSGRAPSADHGGTSLVPSRLRRAAVLTGEAGEKVLRTTPSQSHTEAGTPRRRAQRACSECHLHKTKCSGDLPRCKRCQGNNLACVYSNARRRFLSKPASEHSGQDDALQLRPASMIDPVSGASMDSPDGSFASYPMPEPVGGLAAEYDLSAPSSRAVLTAPPSQHPVQEGPPAPTSRRLL